MKNKILLLMIAITMLARVNAQNVGIGTTTPAYKLDVAGTINSSSNAYVAGFVGIGTTSPFYKLQVEGPVAIHNSTDDKYWYLNYSSSSNSFYVAEDGVSRLTIANGGNVGIGVPSPASKLEVGGSAIIDDNLTVSGATTMSDNASVVGNLTVNNGKGIVRSWNSSQIKYYTQQSSVTAILPAFGTSIEGTIAWPSGIFTNPPQVLVGDEVSTGGSMGQLFRVLLIPYSATANNCKFRLINTSNSSVNYSITYNIVLLGN